MRGLEMSNGPAIKPMRPCERKAGNMGADGHDAPDDGKLGCQSSDRPESVKSIVFAWCMVHCALYILHIAFCLLPFAFELHQSQRMGAPDSRHSSQWMPSVSESEPTNQTRQRSALNE